MAKSRLTLGCVCALICAGLCSLAAGAQKIDPRLKASLVNTLRLEKRLTLAQRRSISNATRNRFALAHQFLETPQGAWKDETAMPKSRSGHGMMIRAAIGSPRWFRSHRQLSTTRSAAVEASVRATPRPRGAVLTSSQATTTVLLVLMTLSSGRGGLSFSGIAHSQDAGKTFADLGYLDPGPAPTNFLVGNPSVACANASRFYYASMFATAIQVSPTKLVFKEAIGINVSSDGGGTWSTPIAAVLKNSEHILERESLAVDTSNPLRLFISYTDIDFETAKGGPCAGTTQMLVELVSSTDGGETWGKPRTIQRVCGSSGNAVNGSQVAVDPSGVVYVAYLFYDNQNGRELIRIRRSLDHGVNFQVPVNVSTVVPAGSDSMLQGFFLSNEYPALAVDRTNGQNRGTVYLAWTDGRNRSQIDVFSGTGVYNFADVLLVKSVDQGKHWSLPVGVSPAATGASRDQFMPGVAVDTHGESGRVLLRPP